MRCRNILWQPPCLPSHAESRTLISNFIQRQTRVACRAEGLLLATARNELILDNSPASYALTVPVTSVASPERCVCCICTANVIALGDNGYVPTSKQKGNRRGKKQPTGDNVTAGGRLACAEGDNDGQPHVDPAVPPLDNLDNPASIHSVGLSW